MDKKQRHKRIIRKPEVRARVGLSDVQIWRLERAGKFPKRVQIGPKAVGWVESEVDEWIDEKVEARGAAA